VDDLGVLMVDTRIGGVPSGSESDPAILACR
jgi:hypothetical protein